MRTFVLAVVLCVLIIIPTGSHVALADNTKTIQTKGAVGCISESALDEFVTAANNKDRRHGQELMSSGLCFFITGRSYSIVDKGFFTTEIRVYTENGSVRLFVPSEFAP